MGNKSSNKRSTEHSFFQKYASTCGPQQTKQPNNLKRAVFLSLIGLYQSFEDCPLSTLWNSIFILPIKLEWIHLKSKKLNGQIGNGRHNLLGILNDKKFVDLLKFKQKQNLLFCTLDYKEKAQNSLHFDASEFWKDLSLTLTQIHDPCNPGDTYNALLLTDQYWKHESSIANADSSLQSMISCVDYVAVLNEIHYLDLKFRTMKAILTENNNSINVIQFGYPNHANGNNIQINSDSFVAVSMTEYDDDNDNDNNDNQNDDNDNWCVCSNYDDDVSLT